MTAPPGPPGHPGPPAGGYGAVPPPGGQPPPASGYPTYPGYPGYPAPPGPPPPYPGPPVYPGYPGTGYGPPPGTPGGQRRTLLVIAAVLLAAAILAAAVAIWRFSTALGAEPPESARFGNGGSTSVEFAANETKIIYTKSDDERHQVYCKVRAQDATSGLDVTTIKDNIVVNDWKATITVTARQPGTYTVTCTGYPDDIFGVGGPISAGRIGAPIGLGLLAGALGLAGVITAVVGLTRPRAPRV